MIILKKHIIHSISFLIILSNVFAQDDESWKIYDDSQVAIVEITVDPADLAWIYERGNWDSDSLHLAQVHFKNTYIDEIVDSVGFRLRGNTSRDSEKKSFKLSFNTFIDGREFYGVDKINLNGEHNDPSIARSKICWDLFQSIGTNATRASHAAVYINGEYYGLYVNVEHIDDEFLNKNFDDPSGNLWKCLYPADLTYRGNNPDEYKFVSGNRRTYELTTNETEDDYSQLARLIKIINNTPDDVFQDSLESILVIEELLKYFAVNNLVGGWDDYWFLRNNFYLYYEPAKDIFHWIPYDYDNTFGVDWFNIDWANINPYTFAKIDNSPRPLVERIMSVPEYRNLFTHFLEFYNENVFNLESIEAGIIDLRDQLGEYAENDYYRRRDYGFDPSDFYSSYSLSHYENQHVKRGIREFISVKNSSLPNMLEYVDGPPIAYGINVDFENTLMTDSILLETSIFSANQLTRAQVELTHLSTEQKSYFQLKYSPVVDSKLVEENDRWIAKIPAPVSPGRYSVKIILNDIQNNYMEFPRGKEISLYIPESSTAVEISEFMARNVSTIADNFGEYDDWLEIHNTGNESINLRGYYLTDDRDNLTKWDFDFDLVLDVNQYALIWCDEDGAQGNDHVNFKLDGDGEFIALVSPDQVTVIDSISFDEQQDDVSFGKDPQTREWGFMSPTPGYENTIVSVDERILIPTDFTVSAYPNPFNPITTIMFNLPSPVQGEGSGLSTDKAGVRSVNLIIYNTLGQQVATLVDETKSPGVYEIEFDASSLSSGIYFLRITSNTESKFFKLMLLK